MKQQSDVLTAMRIENDLGSIRRDPFILSFLDKFSPEVANSFSDIQLMHIKLIYSSRSSGCHSLDYRAVKKFFGWHYYLILLCGRDKVDLKQPKKKLSFISKSFFVSIFSVIGVTLFSIVLYIIKSFLGIDIFPDFSLGLWTWISS